MEDVFPDPFTFDIDRYLPPRNEHYSPGYAPFGLGTHKCMGSRWAEMHIALNVLMLAHHFTFDSVATGRQTAHQPLSDAVPQQEGQVRHQGLKAARGPQPV